MTDILGDRMKQQYENRTRIALPRRTYTVIRVDGKAFHTFTRHCERPYDVMLVACMNVAALTLCREAQGAQFAYIQSDEISVLLTDFAQEKTEAWFDGNLQKICSISAAVTSATFTFNYFGERHTTALAYFDARVFTIPDPTEVENYFIWRQKDAERNSLQMLSRVHFSHSELENKNSAAMHEMLHSKGINWNDLPTEQKRGRSVIQTTDGWDIDNEIPIWTQDRDWLRNRIPRYS